MVETKKSMTEKQRLARLANLKKGRETRMTALKNKKQETADEYDLSSQDDKDSDSSSDDGDFVISKKKPTRKPRSRDDIAFPSFTPKNEFDDLKEMVRDLAMMQKKSNKAIRKQQNNKPVNKLVLLPSAQQASAQSQSYRIRDSVAEQLAKSLGI